jgi:two-component system KDP operon response regulator KdpE
VPLILILRNDCPAERVRGLQMGADDVIPPPFEVQELVLRAGNVLRRAHSAVLRGRFQHPDYDLVLSPALSDVWARGHPIPITPIERKVLKLLVERAGRTIGYDELVEHVWRESASAEGRTRLRQVVTGLRRKIEPDPNHPLFIKTCHGLGYQFATQHWCWIDDQETNSHQPSAISH